jgi:hypothetical protein
LGAPKVAMRRCDHPVSFDRPYCERTTTTTTMPIR